MKYGKEWEKLSTIQKIAEVEAELEKDISRWNEIYTNGCSDPFWPDGVNLELKRNHIINDLRMLSELNDQPTQLSMFQIAFDGTANPDFMDDPRIPPKVLQDYMARDRPCQYFIGRN